MEKIHPSDLPQPRGHYAPGIVHNGTVYVSGQLPVGADGEPQLGPIEAQAELCLRNLERVLLAAGSDLSHVLKLNVYVSDIAHWPVVNGVLARGFGEHRPARAVVPCNPLHYGCEIEMDCVAAVRK